MLTPDSLTESYKVLVHSLCNPQTRTAHWQKRVSGKGQQKVVQLTLEPFLKERKSPVYALIVKNAIRSLAIMREALPTLHVQTRGHNKPRPVIICLSLQLQ